MPNKSTDFSHDNACTQCLRLSPVYTLFRIIITLFHDEVYFLYVIAEFKQFIPLALILLVNLMNKK